MSFSTNVQKYYNLIQNKIYKDIQSANNPNYVSRLKKKKACTNDNYNVITARDANKATQVLFS